MLPCPAAGSLPTFLKHAVFFLHIYECHVSVICLRLLVQKREDTLCSCHCHDNGIHLHAHLVYGHTEAFVKGKKARKTPECQPKAPFQGKGSPHNGADHIADISKLGIDGAQEIGKGISFVRAFEQFVIPFPEFCLAGLLPAEYLDHLLPVHHFLNIAIYRAQIFLLLQKIFSAHAGRFFRTEYHNRHHQKRNPCQRHT